MSKYQINYNRVAPDHRVPFDYNFVKKTESPLSYFKVSLNLNQYYKQGFNTSWLKFYHMHLTGIWIGLIVGVSIYTLGNSSADLILRDKIGKYPGLQ